jgi:hypothetical protein
MLQKEILKTKRSSILQKITVAFLAVAFLMPSGWSLGLASAADLSGQAIADSSLQFIWVEGQHPAFPLDEQHSGFGELEVVLEGGLEGGLDKSDEGAYDRPSDVAYTARIGRSGRSLWFRIGEKNLGVPRPLYLRYHALRIPS